MKTFKEILNTEKTDIEKYKDEFKNYRPSKESLKKLNVTQDEFNLLRKKVLDKLTDVSWKSFMNDKNITFDMIIKSRKKFDKK